MTDAVVAFNLENGRVRWIHQDTANDVWVGGCAQGVAGCADHVGPDWDYGSSPMLQTIPGRGDIIFAAHKGCVALGLDPNTGNVVWRTNLATKPPSISGDIVFGGAVDRQGAYFALQTTSEVASIDLKTGKQRWVVPARTASGRPGPSAAVTAIAGTVFVADWDGKLTALSSADGKSLWTVDTNHEFPTVNGVPAKGGSFGAPGVTVSGGMVFVASGYIGLADGAAGNVVLAFDAGGR